MWIFNMYCTMFCNNSMCIQCTFNDYSIYLYLCLICIAPCFAIFQYVFNVHSMCMQRVFNVHSMYPNSRDAIVSKKDTELQVTINNSSKPYTLICSNPMKLQRGTDEIIGFYPTNHNHEDHRGELINLFVFCQPITDVDCGQLTNESAQFL